MSQKDSEIFIIEDANSDYKEEESKQRLKLMNEKYNFKEKTMIIQGYELYFVKKHGKPFVQQKKGGKLFIKLYLLNLEQINQIFSYINRLEYKKYINNLDSLTQKNSFKIIHNFNKTIYNYSKIFFLDTFMNINIYLFSHTPKTELSSNTNNNMTYSINDLPSSNKIAKIIKALMTNFPDFSKKYFIEYLMKPKKNSKEMNIHDKEILQQKINEVDLLFDEISKYKCECKFQDCLHISESNCAVKVNLDKIDETRYLSYIAFVEEAKKYKERIKYQGVKVESAHKVHNNDITVKISTRKRQSARNTKKQNIFKEIEDGTVD